MADEKEGLTAEQVKILLEQLEAEWTRCDENEDDADRILMDIGATTTKRDEALLKKAYNEGESHAYLWCKSFIGRL